MDYEAPNVTLNAAPEDRRIDLMRHWCQVTDSIERARDEISARELELKELAAKRDELRLQLLGYIDPESLPQPAANAKWSA